MIEINKEEIIKIIQEFFQKMGFEAEIKVLDEIEKTIPVKIKTEEPKILIGQNGQTLREIQHLLKAILKRKISEEFYLDLDINDYKKKKTEYLKEMADSIADEVALSKQEKQLPPMPNYERRIIHLELTKRNDVITESIGEGIDRRVVIKPKS